MSPILWSIKTPKFSSTSRWYHLSTLPNLHLITSHPLQTNQEVLQSDFISLTSFHKHLDLGEKNQAANFWRQELICRVSKLLKKCEKYMYSEMKNDRWINLRETAKNIRFGQKIFLRDQSLQISFTRIALRCTIFQLFYVPFSICSKKKKTNVVLIIYLRMRTYWL